MADVTYPISRDSDQVEISVRDLIDVVYRRRWVALQAFVFVTVVGIILSFRSAPTYTSTSKLLVETPGRQMFLTQVDTTSSLAPLMSVRGQKNIKTQLAMMRSTWFRDRVKEKAQAPGQAPVSLSCENEQETDIVRITTESSDAAAALRWANVAATQYVELTTESNRQAISNTRRFLQQEAAHAKRMLATAEEGLMAFRRRTEMTDDEGERSLRLEDAKSLQVQARGHQTRMLELDAQVQSLRQRLEQEPAQVSVTKATPNFIADSLRKEIDRITAEKAVLSARYQPGSTKIEDLEDQIKTLQEQLVGQPLQLQEVTRQPNPIRVKLEAELKDVEMQLGAARAISQRLEAQLAVGLPKASDYAPWKIKLARLQRERDVAEKRYLSYTEKLQDLEVREKASVAGAVVMEEAKTASLSDQPRRASQIMMALVLGALLGLGLAFLQEFLDDQVNSPEEAQRVTQLPTLGVVPKMQNETNRLLTGYEALSPVTESYRELRTAIQYSTIDYPIRAMLVTSAHSGEGKSVTSANLAIALALQGKQVILVDADLRRPSVHRMFGVDSEPGLTNVLAQETTLEEALVATQVEGLRILCSGPLSPNPPELLNGHALAELLEEMKTHADVVVFDTPPTNLVTDAQVLAGRVDGVVLVVEAGGTRKAALKHAVSVMNRTRARILGTVLNRMDDRPSGYYRYGGYRYGNYRYGTYGDRNPELTGARVAEKSLPPGQPADDPDRPAARWE